MPQALKMSVKKLANIKLNTTIILLTIIALTAKGKALYKKIKPEYCKLIQRLSKPISEKEQKYINAIFVKWLYFLRDFSL